MIELSLVAWGVTVAIETPIVAAVYRGERGRMALACAVVTSVTNLLMNLVLPDLVSSESAYLLVGEIGALVLEAAAYVALSARHEPGRAMVASALANTASYTAGVFMPWGAIVAWLRATA